MYRKRNATQTKTWTIDGVTYRTRQLCQYHLELSNNPLVKSFKLPSINDEKVARGKYGSFKVLVNDILFDSIMESRFYVYLLECKKDHLIQSFERQVTFVLQDKFRDPWTNELIRPITYIADFVVKNNDGITFVVDVKGVETDVFKIKKKLFIKKYPQYKFLCLQRVPTTGQWLTLSEIRELKG